MQDVLSLTQELIRIPSVSRDSNEAVSDAVARFFTSHGFELERLSYRDDNDALKVSLVAKKGAGSGGLGFFSHSDTVPGFENEWPAFEPELRDGKLFGRGSCDMKGPLAATMLAAANVDAKTLKKPVYVVVTSDEEFGFGGAKQVAAESQMFTMQGFPDMGVIAEPSELIPIYSHKGGYWILITAHGKAAHSSTDKGVSANFMIAPFLAEMAALKEHFLTEDRYMDHEFDPPTNGFNMTLNDDNCAGNVTAAKSICTLNFRAMPGVNNKAVVEQIVARAQYYGFEVNTRGYEAFYTSPESEIVKLSLAVTGATQAVTVPYGTEALVYHSHLPLVILGPGNIAQAHTVGEWIDIQQLERSVGIYQAMIERFCC